MVYIKLEENRDKFLKENYFKIPKAMKKMIFQSQCRRGKYRIEKIGTMDFIILPTLNDKLLRNLRNLANIRCWKNICVSDNLLENEIFMTFTLQNDLVVMDGSWLLKNMVDRALEFIIRSRNDGLNSQEIGILCNHLDETIGEKIKEICGKIKICNILTNDSKQYTKLEEEIYQTKGVILNVSNNFKRAITKSSVVINFDFSDKELQKCVFAKNVSVLFVNTPKEMVKKQENGQDIIDYEIQIPEKYGTYQELLEGFSNKVLYESFIYKHTNYKNIKKELEEDDVQIEYLRDSNHKILKNEMTNLPKKLDKMTI